ncbi:MAG TPA: hypothetical protein VLH56_11405 [Dissulfurispiraceae bacterium]|nr:hypothetical protein [Dissulfurispiraceae bacterium]
MGDIAMMIALILLRTIDQILTWLYGRQTEQMAAAKWAISKGLAVYALFCIVTTGLLVAACEASGALIGEMAGAYVYGIVTGMAAFMLERNVVYLIRRKR